MEELRKDLRKLLNCSSVWQMSFNIEKCKVMHMGTKNSEVKYEIGGRELVEVTEEKELGVVVCKDLKATKQCASAAKKRYQVSGMISLAIMLKNKSIILKLYKSLVRLHLEYSIQAW